MSPTDSGNPPPRAGEVLEPAYDTPVNLHSRIMIVPRFLSAQDCDALVKYADRQKASDLSVFDPGSSGSSTRFEVHKEFRNTQLIECSAAANQTLTSLLEHAILSFINPFFGISLQSAEPVQFLKYGVGGHYQPHPDGEAVWHDHETNTRRWKKSIDRDISVLIYLNEGYEGGQLVFPNQHITVNPTAGMLVAFPSDHHFIHGVTPVTSGTRYALASWASRTRVKE